MFTKGQSKKLLWTGKIRTYMIEINVSYFTNKLFLVSRICCKTEITDTDYLNKKHHNSCPASKFKQQSSSLFLLFSSPVVLEFVKAVVVLYRFGIVS